MNWLNGRAGAGVLLITFRGNVNGGHTGSVSENLNTTLVASEKGAVQILWYWILEFAPSPAHTLPTINGSSCVASENLRHNWPISLANDFWQTSQKASTGT